MQHASLLLSVNNGTNHRLPKSFYCAGLCRPSYAHFNAFYNLFQVFVFFVISPDCLNATTFGQQQQHLNRTFLSRSINKLDDIHNDCAFVHRIWFCVSFLSISIDLLLFRLPGYCFSSCVCVCVFVDRFWSFDWTCRIFFIFSQIILSLVMIFLCLRFGFQKSPSSLRFTSASATNNQYLGKIFWFIIEIWIVLFVIFISIFIRMTAMIPFLSLFLSHFSFYFVYLVFYSLSFDSLPSKSNNNLFQCALFHQVTL